MQSLKIYVVRWCFAMVLAGCCWSTVCAEVTHQMRRYSYDTQQRQLWPGGGFQGSPGPADPYSIERVFPNLLFEEPIVLCAIPGCNRLCVATVRGKIYTFPSGSDVTSADLLVDLKSVIYGVAFHPNFCENGFFFVTTFRRDTLSDPVGSRLIRLRAERGEIPMASPANEQEILTWPMGGHDGGCIRFGPDGMLYLATGDGSGYGDELETGQDISDLHSSILRIDVNRSTGQRHYGIPVDNPFVNHVGARGEIWAFGLRHPWKFSFDADGNLWTGDVGQDLWEAIYQVRRGGNYGWSISEAGYSFRPNRTQGPTAIEAPLVVHPHSEFRSITGGYVSRTERLPELVGHYVYGDYDTGKVWAFQFDKRQAQNNRQLVDTQLRIVDIGQDHSGEVLLVDFVGGGIHRLVQSTTVHLPSRFPTKLSQTGLFISTKEHAPIAGLIPYDVNAPLWTDGAHKDRFMALPGSSKIEMDGVFYPQGPGDLEPGWKFSDGTVLVKTFSIALDNSRPQELTRLETRILHLERLAGNDHQYGNQRWNAYTYAWTADQTDAELVEEGGRDLTLTIRDPNSPEGHYQQSWRLPSRTECAVCHNMGSKYVLGLNTLQLNRDYDYGEVVENQLAMYSRLGILMQPLPAPLIELPRLLDYRDSSHSVAQRARSYLHANCAHCHRKWGGGNSAFQLQASLSTVQTGTIDLLPSQGFLGINNPKIVSPGHPESSVLWARMQAVGPGHMPPLGSYVRDDQGIQLVSKWIDELAVNPSLARQSGDYRPQRSSTSSEFKRYQKLLAMVVAAASLLYTVQCFRKPGSAWGKGKALRDIQ